MEQRDSELDGKIPAQDKIGPLFRWHIESDNTQFSSSMLALFCCVSWHDAELERMRPNVGSLVWLVWLVKKRIYCLLAHYLWHKDAVYEMDLFREKKPRPTYWEDEKATCSCSKKEMKRRVYNNEKETIAVDGTCLKKQEIKNQLPLHGLEPWISCSVGRRLIHWATAACIWP